jgi:uncharacterized coiled-coil protein SlyX
MRKTLAPILAIVLVLTLAASAWLFLRYRDTNARYLEMRAAEQSSRDSYSSTLDAIAEIQDSLDAIAPRDSMLRLKPGSLVTEEQMAGPNGQAALEQIATLRASIARSRERILALEENLKHSGVRVDGMRRVIANLQSDLAEKQASLDEMVAQVESLRGQVTGLQSEVQQGRDSLLVRDAALEERRHELATVYYVVGTKDQLLKQGAIVIKGGVLGIGGTPVLTGQLPPDALTPLDTDVLQVIPTTAAKARVLTPQPAASYELRLVDGHIELHILDASEFRKVRQVVILTG